MIKFAPLILCALVAATGCATSGSARPEPDMSPAIPSSEPTDIGDVVGNLAIDAVSPTSSPTGTPPPTDAASTTVIHVASPAPAPVPSESPRRYSAVDGSWTVTFPTTADPQLTSADVDDTNVTIHIAVVDGDEYAVGEARPDVEVDLRGAVIFGVNAISGTLITDDSVDLAGRRARRYRAEINRDGVSGTVHGLVVDNAGQLVIVMVIDRGHDNPRGADAFIASLTFEGSG